MQFLSLLFVLAIIVCALPAGCASSKPEMVTIYYSESMGGKNSTFSDCRDAHVTPAGNTLIVEFTDNSGHHIFAGVTSAVIESKH
jgi:hypothetical protein